MLTHLAHCPSHTQHKRPRHINSHASLPSYLFIFPRPNLQRRRFAGTNLTLSHLFDDPTMLSRMNDATPHAARRFQNALGKFGEKVSNRTFDEDGLTQGIRLYRRRWIQRLCRFILLLEGRATSYPQPTVRYLLALHLIRKNNTFHYHELKRCIGRIYPSYQSKPKLTAQRLRHYSETP
jgi:hypothetical protein